MDPSVEISGDGLTAVCCARLLQDGGTQTAFANTPLQRHGAAILLSGSSTGLLSSLFPDILAAEASPMVRSRQVLWGVGEEATVMPHLAMVAFEESFVPRLRSCLPSCSDQATPADWKILTQNGSPELPQQHAFGSRIACVSIVELEPAAARETCWMESVPSGWLFLFTIGDRNATLISVGEADRILLSESRLVGKQIRGVAAVCNPVPCAPRIRSHLTGPQWLACGTAAMAFDPVCGEGAGNAVREAILASATVRALLRGEEERAVLRYYEARLRLGFLRHLAMCQRFYETGGTGAFWRNSVSDLQQGIRQLSQTVNIADASLYRLNGFELEPVR